MPAIKSKKNAPVEEKPVSAGNIAKKVAELESLVETIGRGKMQWEHTFDVITDPVTIIDGDYRILRANVALARAAGMDVREVIGKKCFEAFAGGTAPCSRCPVQKTLATRQSHSMELAAFPKGRRQYFASAYSMPQQSTAVEEIVLHYRDVTGEKQLQRQLMQTDKMAAIGTLAGGIAHEINNPMGAILAYAQLALRELEESHPCHEYLKEIEEATLRCKKIVRDLLDFSRQSFEDRMQALNINDVVGKAMTLVQVNARHLNISITQSLAPDLPTFVGHFHKLQQVVINLVTNALHAMKDKGGTLTVTTALSADGRHVLLYVEDSGTGIDEEDLDKIFDPYFTTKGQGEGTGLGLSISYNIVLEHRGEVDVESVKGRGTKFTITLPVG